MDLSMFCNGTNNPLMLRLIQKKNEGPDDLIDEFMEILKKDISVYGLGGNLIITTVKSKFKYRRIAVAHHSDNGIFLFGDVDRIEDKFFEGDHYVTYASRLSFRSRLFNNNISSKCSGFDLYFRDLLAEKRHLLGEPLIVFASKPFEFAALTTSQRHDLMRKLGLDATKADSYILLRLHAPVPVDLHPVTLFDLYAAGEDLERWDSNGYTRPADAGYIEGQQGWALVPLRSLSFTAF